MGDMRRNKLFKNWRNEDTDLYLADLCNLIKRDIEIANGTFVEQIVEVVTQQYNEEIVEEKKDENKSEVVASPKVE